MVERLPVVSSDIGTWGGILNGFLGVAHNADGTLRADPIKTASGTITTTTLLADATVLSSGTGIDQLTHYPARQMILRGPDGSIFATHNNQDVGEHVLTNHRLHWSKDNLAATPEVIIDGVTWDDHDYGMAPALECDDATGAVFYIVNHAPRGGSSDSEEATHIHKLSPPYDQTYTHAGTLIATIAASSNKWSAVNDKTRGWLWVCQWENVAGNLTAHDYDGNLVKTVSLFGIREAGNPTPWCGPELYAAATHPNIAVSASGRIYVAWTAESTEIAGIQSYYAPFMVYSDDGGDTWVGPNGTISLPVSADNSGASNQEPFLLANEGVDLILGDDPDYYGGAGADYYNFNYLGRLVAVADDVHAQYAAMSSSGSIFGATNHRPYVRWDEDTEAVDYRREPNFESDSGVPIFGAVPGSFAYFPSQQNRLMLVNGGSGADAGKLASFKCDSPAGSSPVWDLYAMSADIGAGSNGINNINTAREVGPDGTLPFICQQSDTPFGVLAGLIKPAA